MTGIFTAAAVKEKHKQPTRSLTNTLMLLAVLPTGSMNVNGTDINVVPSVLHNKGSKQDILAMRMNVDFTLAIVEVNKAIDDAIFKPSD